MSGHIGDYKSKSHWHTSEQIQASAPEKLINHSTFVFQYGGGTWTTNYNLPAVTTSGSGNHRWFRLRTRYTDSRWNAEGICLVTQTYAGFYGKVYAQWNDLTINASDRLVSLVNGNGGSTSNLTAELLVWEIFGASYPHRHDYFGN